MSARDIVPPSAPQQEGRSKQGGFFSKLFKRDTGSGTIPSPPDVKDEFEAFGQSTGTVEPQKGPEEFDLAEIRRKLGLPATDAGSTPSPTRVMCAGRAFV